MADKKYDSIVYDYFEKRHGTVVLISEDAIFKKMLASTIIKSQAPGATISTPMRMSRPA